MTDTKHFWRFFRAGGFDQVDLANDGDLANLPKLDPKLWVALSCPTSGLEFDQRTLDFIDTDKDGRIRVPEILAAVEFVTKNLKRPEEIRKRANSLSLSNINDATEDGKILLATAKRILQAAGKPDANALTLDDISDMQALFAKTRFNGDGIVPASATDDEAVRTVIKEIIDEQGEEKDRNGEPGTNQEKTDTFFTALQEYAEWWKAGEKWTRDGVICGGAAALSAFEECAQVCAKIDDYFVRCKLAAFNPQTLPTLNRLETELAELGAKDFSTFGPEVLRLPLQRIEPGKPLNLAGGINPAWEARLRSFAASVLNPVLGRGVEQLIEPDWERVRAEIRACEAWVKDKKGAPVEKLGIARIREILASSAREQINTLIKQDLDLKPEFSRIEDVDRLVRYNGHLYSLLRNFVNFADFYEPTASSIFDAGQLYLDQRSCELCLRVADPNAHAAIATLSKMYLAYCNCTRPSGEKMTIVAAFTQGDANYLMAGRNGIFYDRKGRDWDATIVKIVENPISIRQAFWSPYQRIARFIEEQAEKFAAEKEKAAHAGVTGGISAHAASAATPPQAGAQKEGFDVARFAGIFAAIGLAIGAIGGAMGAMLTAFASLAWWQMPLAVAGIMLVISGPSMLMAWLKLRLRTLGPVLEGNGWAINGRVNINIPLGTSLTAVRALPPNSTVSLEDPFEDKQSRRRKRLVAALLLTIAYAVLHFAVIKPRYLDTRTEKVSVAGPAAEPKPAEKK